MKRQCNKKKLTKIEAEHAIKITPKSRKQYRKECRTYYCGLCNAWHLTSDKFKKDITQRPDADLSFKNKWEQLLNSSGGNQRFL